ncbi:MAG: S-adenosylmethionine:tRNA ribosyltransferase-isomerase [Muribaculaceae bacterium]|nr:S-adenosylmethionine:tRNA ribosyltransferase-isomerase [Muribaculaceae bacterium]
MEEIKDIRIEDFDYPLPDERIAKHPLADRDSCKLLQYAGGTTSHHIFSEIPNLLPDGALLVMNNTRVINARMEFFRSSGARIEIFLLEPLDPRDYAVAFQTRGRCTWQCLVGNLKKWKEDHLEKILDIDGRKVTLKAFRHESLPGNAHAVEFIWDDQQVTFASIVEAAGNIPIPPYLNRKSEESDSTDYQTVYSRIEGSVAAPTAGLHFTPELLDRIREKGIETREVTLHVGAGTFQPVKSDEIGEHPMHRETFEVELDLVRTLRQALESGRKVLAVGTTTVRTLESLPLLGIHLLRAESGERRVKSQESRVKGQGSRVKSEGSSADYERTVDNGQRTADNEITQWEAYADEALSIDTVEALKALEEYMEKEGIDHLSAATSIMIAPGFKWRIVDGMVTNFHQPQSTLLLLVSSLLDGDNLTDPLWRRIYQEALDNDYRFLSYGDACLFLNDK